MSKLLALFLGIILLILFWFSSLFNYSSLIKEAVPKLVYTTLDYNIIDDINSLILKSILNNLSNKQTANNSANKENKFNILYNTSEFRLLKNILNNTCLASENHSFEYYNNLSNYIYNNTSISMFIEDDRKYMNLLLINNVEYKNKEKSNLNRFENMFGEIAYFQLEMNNVFINNNKNIYKKCWNMGFPGRILGAVGSSDKKILVVYYSYKKGPNTVFRIRVIHNLSCENNNIYNMSNTYFSDLLFNKKENNELLNTSNFENEDYFYIGNNNTNISKHNNQYNDNVANNINYFNINTFDDFALHGSSPINSLAVKKDIIIYSRLSDYREFYVLKRNNNNKKQKFYKSSEKNTKWEVVLLGNKFDNYNKRFFFSNSFKIIDSKIHDLILFNINISLNREVNSNVMLSSFIIKANITSSNKDASNEIDYNSNQSLETIANDKIKLLITNSNNIEKYNISSIDIEEIMFDNEELDEIKNIKYNSLYDYIIYYLKPYIRPTITSNNSINGFSFEFIKGQILSLDNKIIELNENDEFYLHNINSQIVKNSKINKYIQDILNKSINYENFINNNDYEINKIINDKSNTNIIIQMKNKRDMFLIHRETKEVFTKDNKIYYSFTGKGFGLPINLKYYPKSLKDKDIMGIYIEKLYNKHKNEFFYYLFLLNADGNIAVMDLTSSILNKGFKTWNIIEFIRDMDYLLIFIIIAYFILLPVMFKFALYKNNSLINLFSNTNNNLINRDNDLRRLFVINNNSNQNLSEDNPVINNRSDSNIIDNDIIINNQS